MYIYPVTTIASSRTVAQYAQFLGLRLQGMQGAVFGTTSVRITIPRQRPVRLFGSGRGKGSGSVAAARKEAIEQQLPVNARTLMRLRSLHAAYSRNVQ